MMRKLLTTVAAITAAGVIAFGIAKAANLPLFSNVALQEPSQELAALNTLVNNINAGVTGNLGYINGPVANPTGNSTTANQSLASTTIVTNQLVAAGQGIFARCSGINASGTTNAKVGLAIGKAMSVSLESIPGTNPQWDLEVQFHAATSPVTANYTWVGRGFASDASGTATNFMAVNGGNDTNTSDNLANNSVPVSCVVYAGTGGIATGSVTMENFIVQVLR